MSRFELFIPSLSAAEVVLQLCAHGAKSVTLGPRQQLLTPLLPDLMGQYVLLVVFERHFDDGLDDDRVAYVIPPQRPSARLLSCWMGKMAAVWPDEPIVDRLKPIVSEESVARWDRSLSEVFYELLRTSLTEQIVLFVGTAAVLTELQRLLTGLALLGHETRIVEAILGLGVSRTDLGVHAPYLLSIISQVIEQHQATLDNRETDLHVAEQALETAQLTFGLAQRQRNAVAERVEQLMVLRRGWLRRNPEPDSSVPLGSE